MTAPHLGPGHTIAGKYRIVSLLGFTGEVATYRALGQAGELVVKLYDPAIGQRADVMSRLERTHATLAALPEGAIRVVDSGYDLGTGAPFAATELLTLPSLAQIAAPMPPEAVAAMLQGLAKVMDAAHARQLHHHALKPTNVFVQGSIVRVTDFDASVVRNTSPTHEAYARSAPWWAPEQLNPSAVLGGATDVFAAALIAFYALTGRSFWFSCQSSPPDLQRWQAEVMAPRPTASQRAHELGSAINPALDVMFERGLAVSQADRPQSIGELANAFASLAGYRTDTGVKTLAFPEMSMPVDGGYPGPRSPAGGAAGDVQAMPPAVARDAARPIEARPDGGYGQSQGPGLPPIPLEPKKKKSPVLPIILGVTAALLVGAAGVTFLFMRGDEAADAAADRASGGAPASATAKSEDSPNEDGAQAEDDEDATGSGGAKPEEPAAVKVTIRCEPICDELWVDGKKLDEKPEAATDIDLAPGKHELKMVASGHFPRTDTIVLETGKPLEKEYRLVRIGTTARPKPKPCGQFLKPCP